MLRQGIAPQTPRAQGASRGEGTPDLGTAPPNPRARGARGGRERRIWEQPPQTPRARGARGGEGTPDLGRGCVINFV
ncbi:hypothetical protein NO758_03438 [Planktothrix agardhii]|nr:hypothetical protein NO758_03438 [Planktothrix agardhii]